MVEAGLFITGTVLPLSENSEKSMESNIRCEAFGKIDAWKISGYNEGWPKIWLSAKVADYCCVEPAIGYKKQYDLFFKKAVACIEVYQELSECKPGCRLGQLLAPVARSLSGTKFFSGSIISINEYVQLHGEFIYKQMISSLEKSLKKHYHILAQLPALTALKNESVKLRDRS